MRPQTTTTIQDEEPPEAAGTPRAGTKRPLSRQDLIAGATTAVLLVPQAMGYAALAGLPPVAGLYAATVPLVLYALLGRSRQLAIGPVALDSMLVAATVGPLAAGDASRAWALASLLAIMVGGLHLAMAAVGGARLTRWLTRPVLTGFTAAAAVM
ncbi:MAG: hypothetical protein GXP55_12395, partial [Deltaproteobacteria bacterium]|nr:hypothetical protein [Deltaproteobacteria bacterium]